MFLKKLKVKGKLGLEQEFKAKNIILGENNTGKSTFMNLILYSLGGKVESFIEEIKKGYCDQVELDVKCKNNNSYRIIRALPYSEMLTVIPFDDDDKLMVDEARLLDLKEFSDFFLIEEGYSVQTISYGKNKSASLRLYFLLRAVFVDQNTNASSLLSNLGGDGDYYINNQKLIKKAVIEELLGRENNEVQQLRFNLNEYLKEKHQLNAHKNVIKEIINREMINYDELAMNSSKIVEMIENVNNEKNQLYSTKIDNMQMINSINEDVLENELITIKKEKEFFKSSIRKLKLELLDIESVIQRFSTEINELSKSIVARQIFTQIPVNSCPVCLSHTEFIHNEKDCTFCNNKIDTNYEESKLRYKRMLDESYKEAIYLKNEMEKELVDLSKTKDKLDTEYNKINNQILENVDIKQPMEQIVYSIKDRYEFLIKKEQIYSNFLSNLKYKEEIESNIYELDIVIKKLKTYLTELESASISNDKDKIDALLHIFNISIRYIFEDVRDVEMDDNLMPIIDGNDLGKVSSASLKVATRLSYILTLLKLNDISEININHLGFVLFDSPKDKDLDPNKYVRFLELIKQVENGQVILTGSIEDEQLYKGIFNEEEFILRLYPSEKLLKEIIVD